MLSLRLGAPDSHFLWCTQGIEWLNNNDLALRSLVSDIRSSKSQQPAVLNFECLNKGLLGMPLVLRMLCDEARVLGKKVERSVETRSMVSLKRAVHCSMHVRLI